MLDNLNVVAELCKRFKELNPKLMAQPSSHEPKHGMGLLGRPFSDDRLKLDGTPHNFVIDIYKREGLIYTSNIFKVSRWAMARSLKCWGVTLNGGFTPKSLRRFSDAVIISHRTRPREQGNRLFQRGSETILPEIWPFIQDTPRTEHKLVLIVNEAVPKGLPESHRADICQELLLALLEHQIEIDDLTNSIPEFIKRQYKLFPTKYRPFSLDKPLSDDNDFSLLDKLHEGNIIRRW